MDESGSPSLRRELVQFYCIVGAPVWILEKWRSHSRIAESLPTHLPPQRCWLKDNLRNHESDYDRRASRDQTRKHETVVQDVFADSSGAGLIERNSG